MNADNIANVLMAITTVALVTTIVSSPRTAGIIRSFGDAFAGSLQAAMGN